jgi:hypothetical protein
MAIDTGIGISLTQVTTTRQAPLGQTVLKPAGSDGLGEQVWIYVQNVAGAALSAGDLCRRDLVAPLSTATVIRTPASAVASGQVLGVAQHAIADQSFGWILRSGVGDVFVGALTAVGVSLVTSVGTAVGKADPAAAATDDSFGVALTASAASVTAVIDCKG